MQRIALSTILAVSLLSTVSYAAVGGKSANGQPFSTLQELIDANTAEIENNSRLIAENATLIASNTTYITELQTRADAAELAISSLESRISQNEIDISNAKFKILNSEEDIATLNTSLFQLSTELKSSISTLETELGELNSKVITLSDNLTGLKADISVAISDLDTALAGNTQDISVLSALLSTMNGKLTTAIADIVSLNTRVLNAQSNLDSQRNLLDSISDELAELDLRVIGVEEGIEGSLSVDLLTDAAQTTIKGWITDIQNPSFEIISKMSPSEYTPTTELMQNVYNKTNILVIMKLSNGNIIGGYTGSAQFITNGYYMIDSASSNAFLFNLNRSTIYRHSRFEYATYGNYNYSYYGGYGPTFGGGHDLYISGNYTGYCNIGHTYGDTTKYGQTAYRDEFCGYSGWIVKQIEIYQVK